MHTFFHPPILFFIILKLSEEEFHGNVDEDHPLLLSGPRLSEAPKWSYLARSLDEELNEEKEGRKEKVNNGLTRERKNKNSVQPLLSSRVLLCSMGSLRIIITIREIIVAHLEPQSIYTGMHGPGLHSLLISSLVSGNPVRTQWPRWSPRRDVSEMRLTKWPEGERRGHQQQDGSRGQIMEQIYLSCCWICQLRWCTRRDQSEVVTKRKEVREILLSRKWSCSRLFPPCPPPHPHPHTHTDWPSPSRGSKNGTDLPRAKDLSPDLLTLRSIHNWLSPLLLSILTWMTWMAQSAFLLSSFRMIQERS